MDIQQAKIAAQLLFENAYCPCGLEIVAAMLTELVFWRLGIDFCIPYNHSYIM